MASEAILTLLQGSVRSFDIDLVDSEGVAENLTGATEATFRVLADPEDASSPELDMDTTVGDLTIDIANSKLVGTQTQTQADALTPGLYIGQARVKVSGSWILTDPFHVRVQDSFAPTV